MNRPENLPDFSSPPLDELVMGVQFVPLVGFTVVATQDIWNLFRDEFPGLEQQSPIAPQFEAFGGWSPQPNFSFQFNVQLSSPRLWFVSEDGNHLIQFQHDRLMLNWRRINGEGVYPRFENIVDRFATHLAKLSDHVQKAFGQKLEISQSEVAYINAIPVESYSEIGRWIEGASAFYGDSEVMASNSSKVLHRGDDMMARLHNELHSAMSGDMSHKAIRMALTVRGKPTTSEISSALEFIRFGREAIVNEFAALTTKGAHEAWGRK